MYLIPLSLVLEYSGISGAELGFVEALAELLGRLSYLLIDFLLDLG